MKHEEQELTYAEHCVAKLPLHPLINPKSSHYDNGKKTAIEELEEELTVQEMIGYCKGNIKKYSYRLEEKGQKESDLIKIQTYEAYLRVLLLIYSGYMALQVKMALTLAGIKFRYR